MNRAEFAADRLGDPHRDFSWARASSRPASYDGPATPLGALGRPKTSQRPRELSLSALRRRNETSKKWKLGTSWENDVR